MTQLGDEPGPTEGEVELNRRTFVAGVALAAAGGNVAAAAPAAPGASPTPPTLPTVPPGMTAARFQTALQRLRDAVGTDWVFTRPEDLATYKDAHSPFWGEREERVASAAVAPGSVQEVQQVVRIANEFRLPIYPIPPARTSAMAARRPTCPAAWSST